MTRAPARGTPARTTSAESQLAKRRRGVSRKDPPATSVYSDPEGNVLTLRQALSPKTIAKIGEGLSGQATSIDDAWRRRSEMLFERLAVRWEIAGMPLDDQSMLIGRYRMADEHTQRWVRETIATHIAHHLPELNDG